MPQIFCEGAFCSFAEYLIDSISALVASWESTRIVAYVPEAARLTTVPVQVVNEWGRWPGRLGRSVLERREPLLQLPQTVRRLVNPAGSRNGEKGIAVAERAEELALRPHTERTLQSSCIRTPGVTTVFSVGFPSSSG